MKKFLKEFWEGRNHLSPESDSGKQQMIGAFWTMFAFMTATFIFKIFVYIAAIQILLEKSK